MSSTALPEIVAVGIYNAQIAIKNRAVSPNRKTTMFELELPLCSGGTSYMDDTASPICENMVICAKPGQLRHTRLPFQCYYIHMIAGEGQIHDILSSLPNYLPLRDAKEIRELFVSLCEYAETGVPADELMLQSLTLKLIYTLDRLARSSHITHFPKANNHKVIERTLAFIEKNLSLELTLAGVAEEMRFSPIYFHKLFKASTGKTLHEYITDQRLRRAIGLLVSSDMTLSQIAYECGFSSQTYFSFAFKRKMKQTPREYARSILLRYEV